MLIPLPSQFLPGFPWPWHGPGPHLTPIPPPQPARRPVPQMVAMGYIGSAGYPFPNSGANWEQGLCARTEPGSAPAGSPCMGKAQLELPDSTSGAPGPQNLPTASPQHPQDDVLGTRLLAHSIPCPYRESPPGTNLGNGAKIWGGDGGAVTLGRQQPHCTGCTSSNIQITARPLGVQPSSVLMFPLVKQSLHRNSEGLFQVLCTVTEPAGRLQHEGMVIGEAGH